MKSAIYRLVWGLAWIFAASPLLSAQSVTVSATSLSFGNRVLGTSSVQKVTLKNGQSTSVTINGISSSLPDFTWSTGCSTTLAAGGSCTISVTFTPQSLGLRTGTLTIIDTGASSPQTVALSGTGVAAVTATPSSISFGNQPIGVKSAAATVTVKNNQTKNLSISSISTNLADYTDSSTCPIKPKTLAAGATCTVNVFFTPVIAGTRTGTLKVTDNASVSPTVTLSGTGTTSATLVSIAVAPANATFAVGTTQQFKATGTYSDGSTQDLTATASWDTANHAIATVNSQGLASGIVAGATTVTATSGSISGSTSLTVTPAALVSIAVTPAIPSAALGTTQQFHATGTFTDGSTQDITATVQWTSATTTVATISNSSGSQGLATTVGTGSTKISAASGAISGSTTLTVTAAALVSIAVTPGTPSIALGTTQQFTATGTFTDSSTQNLTATVTWSSDTPATATISKAGLATSVGIGTAKISATSGTISGSTVLSVTAAALVSISVSPPAASVPLGNTQQFTATGTYTDGTTQDVTQSGHWTSSAASVATISNSSGTNGLATTLGTGSTTIGISSGSVSSSATLTVTAAALVSIAISPQSPTIPLGTAQQFTAAGTYTDGSTRDVTSLVNWSSSSTQVATIGNTSGSNGLATSAGVGTTNITAALGQVIASTSITVGQPAIISITISPASISVPLGSSQQFTATANYSDGSTQDVTQSCSWASSALAVATVNSSGLAASLAIGSTSISASSGTASGSTVLTVLAAAPVALAIAPLNPAVYATSSQQFSAAITYTDGTSQDATNSVNWSSSNPAVATISTSGQANALNAGTSTIAATAGSLTASTALSVSAPAVTVTPNPASLTYGGTQQFAASISGIANQSVTWSMTGVGTLSSAGVYVAPTVCNTTAQAATVTATSVQSPSSTGTATVTITASTCAPISVSLYPPAATIGGGSNLTFNAAVANDGSNAGVTWSMTGTLGSLSNQTTISATLNSANVSSAVSGTIVATSIADPTKSTSVPVTISPQSQCGPPSYGCSRSDFVTTQLPASIPSMGGATGVNTIVTPPDFAVPILRATDATTNNGFSMQETPSGANGDNIWNTNSTMLLATIATTGYRVVLGFDPVNMQSTGLVPGFKIGGGVTFSRVYPNILYSFNNSQITKWTFTDTHTAPTSTVLYDFASCPGLPSPLNITWHAQLTITSDDSIIGTALSTTGGQDTGVWAVAYNASLNACSAYNTQSGQVVGDWGVNGPASDSASYAIHDGVITRGAFYTLSTSKCFAGDCTGVQQFFWQPGTTTVNRCSLNCGGHVVPGYDTFLNFTSFPQVAMRKFETPDTYTFWPGQLPSPCCKQVLEAHMSWNYRIANDNSPFFATSSTTPNQPSVFNTPLVNEIIGYMPDGTLHRFAHTYSMGNDPSFYAQNAIGSVSQDGHWFAWSSDWMNTMGVDAKQNQRIDVFVVQLQ